MNTKKLNKAKRLNINLDETTNEMLERMAKAASKSKSQVLREIIRSGMLEEALKRGFN